MPSLAHQRIEHYVYASKYHPAWRLLASAKAPLLLAWMEDVLRHQPQGVTQQEAARALGSLSLVQESLRRGLVQKSESGLIAPAGACVAALRFAGRLMESRQGQLGALPEPPIALLEREASALARDARDTNEECCSDELLRQRVRQLYALGEQVQSELLLLQSAWLDAHAQLRQALACSPTCEYDDKTLRAAQNALQNSASAQALERCHKTLEHPSAGASALMKDIALVLQSSVASEVLSAWQYSSLQTLAAQLLKTSTVLRQQRQSAGESLRSGIESRAQLLRSGRVSSDGADAGSLSMPAALRRPWIVPHAVQAENLLGSAQSQSAYWSPSHSRSASIRSISHELRMHRALHSAVTSFTSNVS